MASGISELQNLLAAIGEVPDLVILARHAASSQRTDGGDRDRDLSIAKRAKTAHPNEVQASDDVAELNLSRLFRMHVGPFDDVLGGFFRIYGWAMKDEIANESERPPAEHPCEVRYRSIVRRDVSGPKPDLWVYAELFLGRETVDDIRKNYSEELSRKWGPNCNMLNDINRNFLSIRRNGATFEDKINILTNILRYLRGLVDINNEKKMPHWKLLRFAAIYGLSGVMTDILDGKYGQVCGDLSIDNMLPVDDDVPDVAERSLYMNTLKLRFPPYIIGSALGHAHVTKHAVLDLGAELHGSLKYTVFKRGEEDKILDGPDSAGVALHWAIDKNHPDMVRCLTLECGVQFRWLSDEKLDGIWSLLFSYSEYEGGAYKGVSRNDEDDGFCGSRREMRWKRAHASYKVKEAMLRVLIECGLPRELFVPDADFSFDKEMMKNYKGKLQLEYEDKYKKHMRSLPKKDRRNIGQISAACSEFNYVQPRYGTEDEYDSSDDDPDEEDCKTERPSNTLFAHDFYDRLIGMWKDQPVTQESKLTEFEKYDPRWVAEKEEAESSCEEEEDYESDCSDDSDY